MSAPMLPTDGTDIRQAILQSGLQEHAQQALDRAIARVAFLEETADQQHRRGMLHACALLSLMVYDNDGQVLDQKGLIRRCDDVAGGVAK